MFQKPTKQLILIGLGGLLAIQLTGLSCLNDWQQGDALNGAHAQYRATQGTDGPDLPAADGCPCHLTFSFPFRLLVIARSLKGNENVRWHGQPRSEEHTSELQSLAYLVCRLLLEKKKKQQPQTTPTSYTTHSMPPRTRIARCQQRYHY